ncbi:hypothetical protein BH09MYX1_BH09MYX1_26940 [soil metagenome]
MSSALAVTIATLIALVAPACVATAAPIPPRRAESPPAPAGANADPPGKPPSADAVWVPAHWHWNGTENVWARGRWEVPPGSALYGP